MTLLDTLGITTISVEKNRVEMRMPVRPEIYQPHGFLHGGATIALLESCASRAGEELTDFDKELIFGLETTIGRKQFWHVIATDELGDTISEGTFITKIVTKEHFAEKQRKLAAEHKA